MAKENTKTTAPELVYQRQGWHFASDGIRPAMYIEATNLEEATKIFMGVVALSTPLPEVDKNDVQ